MTKSSFTGYASSSLAETGSQASGTRSRRSQYARPVGLLGPVRDAVSVRGLAIVDRCVVARGSRRAVLGAHVRLWSTDH